MKVGALAALSLLVVMTGPSEGRWISACGLKAELWKQVPRGWGTVMIARVICQLEALSGLDTTLVRKCPRPGVTTASPAANDTATVPPTNGSSTRGIAYSTAAPQQADTTATPGNGIGMVIQNRRRKREAGHRTDNSLPEEEEEQGGGCQPGTGYYGIFQLSDRIFCDSGENPSRNLCRTRCSAFADDDISDDISCILRTGYWRHLFSGGPSQCRSFASIIKYITKLWCR